MQISVKNIWPWLLLALAYTALLGMFMFGEVAMPNVLIGQWLITCGCCVALATDKRPYSFNKMFWIFNLVFFGVIPVYEIVRQKFSWFQDFATATCFRANLVIMSSLAVYAIVRFLAGRINIKTSKDSSYSDSFLKNYKIAGTIIFAICAISIIWAMGFEGLWTKGAALEAELKMNSTVQLVFDKTVRGIILYFLLLTVWLYKQQKIALSRLLVVLAVCVIVCFPFAMPRYLVATLYGSLLLSWQFNWLERRNTFSVLVVGALLFVLPMSALVRYDPDNKRTKNVFALYDDALKYGEYDSYATICRTVDLVAQKGTTKGRQLSGVLLFFVPRRKWEDKPIGSGAYIYSDHTALGANFRNIACPYYAEGMINFGWVGCLVFVACLSFIVTLYDKYYWLGDQASLRYLRLFYPVALFMVFFMLRGDLMSSFAYSVGFFVSGWVVHRVLLGFTSQTKPAT